MVGFHAHVHRSRCGCGCRQKYPTHLHTTSFGSDLLMFQNVSLGELSWTQILPVVLCGDHGLRVQISNYNLELYKDKRANQITKETTRKWRRDRVGKWVILKTSSKDDCRFIEKKIILQNSTIGQESETSDWRLRAQRLFVTDNSYRADLGGHNPLLVFVQLIWNAVARVREFSFNSKLFKWSDILIPLPKILCHFRQFPVAVSGDLMETFHLKRIRFAYCYSCCVPQ